MYDRGKGQLKKIHLKSLNGIKKGKSLNKIKKK